jgi:hypothetical protein
VNNPNSQNSADPFVLATQFTFGPAAPEVPEPTSLAVLALGTVAVAGWRCRRRRHAPA